MYKCECLECGHKMSSDKHCKDIKCPKCGGEMRRAERPGIGATEMIEGYLLAQNAEPREEIMLFPYGDWKHPTYGTLHFNNKFFAEIIENYENNVLGTKPFLDKGHEEDNAFGWFNTVPYIRPGKGLFAKPDWTPVGTKKVSEKEYMYFSPWWGTYKDPQTGKEYKNVFKGGAATNIPFLKTMPPISDDIQANDSEYIELKLSDLYIEGQSDSDAGGGNADEAGKSQKSGKSGDDKNIKEKRMNEKLRKLLIKQYKLDEEATDEQIEEAAEKAEVSDAEKLKKENEELKKENEELKKDEEGDEEGKENKELSEKLNKTEKQLTEMRMEKVIDKALSDGKIIVKEKKYWQEKFMSDPEGTTDIIDHLQKIVDFSEKGYAGSEGETEMSECKLMDEAREMYEKKVDSGDKEAKLSDCIIKVREKYPELGKEYAKKYLSETKYSVDKF